MQFFFVKVCSSCLLLQLVPSGEAYKLQLSVGENVATESVSPDIITDSSDRVDIKNIESSSQSPSFDLQIFLTTLISDTTVVC